MHSEIRLIGIWLIGISGSKQLQSFREVLLSHSKCKFYNCSLPEIFINWIPIKWIPIKWAWLYMYIQHATPTCMYFQNYIAFV